MPLLRMNDVGPAITPSDLEKLQRRLGKSLLPEHREFLLKYNGGNPEPNSLRIRVAEMEAIDLETLYGIGGEFDLLKANEYHEDMIAKNAVIIGCDGLGNSYYVITSGSKRGSVWFLDAEDPDFATYQVAGSFQELLDKLETA